MNWRDRAQQYQDDQDAFILSHVKTPEVDRAFAEGGLHLAMQVAMRRMGGKAPPDRVLWHIRRATESDFNA